MLRTKTPPAPSVRPARRPLALRRRVRPRPASQKMSDKPDNPNPFRLHEGGTLGFSDDGERVAVVWPQTDGPDQVELSKSDADRVRRETIVRFLEWITGNKQDAEFIGRRCLVLAYFLRLKSAPENLDELAARLGVCKSRAWQIVQEQKLNAENDGFSGEFAQNGEAD
jgi:hypothetical protein